VLFLIFNKVFRFVFNYLFLHVHTGTSYQDLGVCENSGQWPDNGQDTSGSDQPDCEDEEQTRSLDTKPCFILGEDICGVKQPQQIIQISDTALKSINNDGNQHIPEQVVSMTFIQIFVFYVFLRPIFNFFKIFNFIFNFPLLNENL